VACRPRPREDPEGRRIADRRFRHVSTGAAVFTAEGGARLKSSQGTRYAQSSTVRSKISPRRGSGAKLNGESRRSRAPTRPRAREWAVCSAVARERGSALHSLNAFWNRRRFLKYFNISRLHKLFSKLKSVKFH